jgi:hypothetical protein
MLLIVAVLNIIWGIAAIDQATFFVEDQKFIISDLKTWGWIILIIGVLQAFAAFSIWSGGEFGALLSIAGYPFWSLAVFGVDLLIIYGLAAYGGQRIKA